MVVAPIAAEREPRLRALLETLNAKPALADPCSVLLLFGGFDRLHFPVGDSG